MELLDPGALRSRKVTRQEVDDAIVELVTLFLQVSQEDWLEDDTALMAPLFQHKAAKRIAELAIQVLHHWPRPPAGAPPDGSPSAPPLRVPPEKIAELRKASEELDLPVRLAFKVFLDEIEMLQKELALAVRALEIAGNPGEQSRLPGAAALARRVSELTARYRNGQWWAGFWELPQTHGFGPDSSFPGSTPEEAAQRFLDWSLGSQLEDPKT